MNLTHTEMMIRKEQGQKVDPFQTCLIAESPFAGWPNYPEVMRLYRKPDERQDVIKHALAAYAFLIPHNTIFRLCYLGELIKKHCDNERSKVIGDLLLIVGDEYTPFAKFNNSLRQL